MAFDVTCPATRHANSASFHSDSLGSRLVTLSSRCVEHQIDEVFNEPSACYLAELVRVWEGRDLQERGVFFCCGYVR